MSAFEFFFSFYALLLGLCVAQIANGIGHAIVVRRESRFGWLTPVLATFVLMDLASFWVNAWQYQKAIGVSTVSIYAGMLIALSYYIAVVLLFPPQQSDWSDLDNHYWANKKWVVLGVALANAATFAWFVGSEVLRWPIQGYLVLALYWTPLVLLFASRRKWLDGVCFALLIFAYVIGVLAEIFGA